MPLYNQQTGFKIVKGLSKKVSRMGGNWNSPTLLGENILAATLENCSVFFQSLKVCLLSDPVTALVSGTLSQRNESSSRFKASSTKVAGGYACNSPELETINEGIN